LLFILLLVEGRWRLFRCWRSSLWPIFFSIRAGKTEPGDEGSLVVFAAVHIPPGFWVFGCFFVGFNLLKGILEVAIRYAILLIKYAVLRGLFGSALQVFFKARWEFFSSSDQGKLLNTMNKELVAIGDTLGHLATLLAQVFQLGIYLAVPLWLNAPMTLATVGLAVLLGAPFLLLQRLSYRLGKRNTETANALMGVLTEVMGAARLILGFGRQNQARERYLDAFDRHVHVTLRSQTLERRWGAFSGRCPCWPWSWPWGMPSIERRGYRNWRRSCGAFWPRCPSSRPCFRETSVSGPFSPAMSN
jgi:ATP-binding cassette subfamily B protein